MEQAAQQATAMQVNLRKANALQESIMEAIRGIELENTITLTEFDDVDSKLAEAQAKLVTNMGRIDRLYQAYYDIRTVVGEQNSRGISAKLAVIAQHEKIIGVLTGQANVQPRLDANVIKGKLAKIAKGTTDGATVYGRREEVTTSILDAATIQAIKSDIVDLKKTKRKLQDSLLEDNINTKVTLPQNVVDTLNTEKLI